MSSVSPWPSLTYEEREWHPAGSAASGTYQSAVVPLIAGLTPRLGPEARSAVQRAEQELVRFDAELGASGRHGIPLLPSVEAMVSSRIERITTPAWAVLAAERGHRISPEALDVAANINAVRHGLDSDAQSTTDLALEMHEILLREHDHHTPGHMREQAVWIGAGSTTPVDATYVAPHHEHIPWLMEDLDAFISDSSVSALTMIAVAHAQFETIHPFTDGNGRVGRALMQSMLRRRGITAQVLAPISAGLLADVEGYYAALNAYRNGDIDQIITVVAYAALHGIGNARRLIEEVTEQRTSWNDMLPTRRRAGAWKLLDILAEHPVVDASTLSAQMGNQRTNIYAPMRNLVEGGIAEPKAVHRLGPFWRSTEICAAIESFIQRADRAPFNPTLGILDTQTLDPVQPPPAETAGVAWPAASFEDRRWGSARSTQGMLADGYTPPRQRYSSALPPLIASRVPRPRREVSAAAAQAERELVAFDAEVAEMALDLFDATPLLLRVEAATAAELDGTSAALWGVFLFEIDHPADAAAQSVVASIEATKVALGEPLSLPVQSVRLFHALVSAGHWSQKPGQLRDRVTWAEPTLARRPQQASWVPPHPVHLNSMLEDLVEFTHDLDVPPLVSAAVAHAQFEAISPFAENNARTACVMMQSMLRSRGITSTTSAPIASGLLGDSQGYREALLAYTRGDVNPIISCFTEATMRGVHNARELVADLARIRRAWHERLLAPESSSAGKIADRLMRRPVLTNRVLIPEMSERPNDIQAALRTLKTAEIVKYHSAGRSNYRYSPEVMLAMLNFKKRARLNDVDLEADLFHDR